MTSTKSVRKRLMPQHSQRSSKEKCSQADNWNVSKEEGATHSEKKEKEKRAHAWGSLVFPPRLLLCNTSTYQREESAHTIN